jgi:hypothetical protein
MKLFITSAVDRDTVVVALARNGYTVRKGKEKHQINGKSVSFVEIIEDAKTQRFEKEGTE